ncbi:MAG TPA: hypothetical protein VGQ59_20900 [Cyclobacteriaceae bacterium]|jgi:hypothetical protein|nr:hypothetical protein [Cyclobacteriaceae bacterium]
MNKTKPIANPELLPPQNPAYYCIILLQKISSLESEINTCKTALGQLFTFSQASIAGASTTISNTGISQAQWMRFFNTTNDNIKKYLSTLLKSDNDLLAKLKTEAQSHCGLSPN